MSKLSSAFLAAETLYRLVRLIFFRALFGKWMVNRRVGFYTDPADECDGFVRQIAGSGYQYSVGFSGQCPWEPSRSPRLAEVLTHWKSLVEDGTWEVDENGVSTPHDWFTASSSLAKLQWMDYV